MPRFRLATILIGFAAVALWLSTFAAYMGAEDVRMFIMLATVVASAANAIYASGSRRAFWGGFFAAMLAMGSRTAFVNYSPRLTWLSQVSLSLSQYVSRNPINRKQGMEAIQTTLYFLLWLIMATLLGLLCVYVYRRYNKAPQ